MNAASSRQYIDAQTGSDLHDTIYSSSSRLCINALSGEGSAPRYSELPVLALMHGWVVTSRIYMFARLCINAWMGDLLYSVLTVHSLFLIDLPVD
jgi:hypothetical protein